MRHWSAYGIHGWHVGGLNFVWRKTRKWGFSSYGPSRAIELGRFQISWSVDPTPYQERGPKKGSQSE